MSELKPHEILGVAENASIAEIKHAYRELVMMFHPDRNPDDPQAAEQFRQATEAFDAMIRAKSGGKLPPWAQIWINSGRELLDLLSSGVELGAQGDLAGMFGAFQAAAGGAQERIAEVVAVKDKCVETWQGVKAVGGAIQEAIFGKRER